MKALDRYVKKSGKAHPYGEEKSKGSWKGPKGVKEKGQYAKESGRKVVDESADFDESDAGDAGIAGYESVRGYKAKKKDKKRSYLEE